MIEITLRYYVHPNGRQLLPETTFMSREELAALDAVGLELQRAPVYQGKGFNWRVVRRNPHPNATCVLFWQYANRDFGESYDCETRERLEEIAAQWPQDGEWHSQDELAAVFMPRETWSLSRREGEEAMMRRMRLRGG